MISIKNYFKESNTWLSIYLDAYPDIENYIQVYNIDGSNIRTLQNFNIVTVQELSQQILSHKQELVKYLLTLYTLPERKNKEKYEFRDSPIVFGLIYLLIFEESNNEDDVIHHIDIFWKTSRVFIMPNDENPYKEYLKFYKDNYK